jgi:hypothetical protein
MGTGVSPWQVAAEPGSAGERWQKRYSGFSAKKRFGYKINFVGYAEGESFRKIYARVETSVKRFGQADGVELW